MKHPTLSPCPNCGAEDYDHPPRTDGIAVEWDCADCGVCVGELPAGPEP